MVQEDSAEADECKGQKKQETEKQEHRELWVDFFKCDGNRGKRLVIKGEGESESGEKLLSRTQE